MEKTPSVWIWHPQDRSCLNLQAGLTSLEHPRANVYKQRAKLKQEKNHINVKAEKVHGSRKEVPGEGGKKSKMKWIHLLPPPATPHFYSQKHYGRAQLIPLNICLSFLITEPQVLAGYMASNNKRLHFPAFPAAR